MKLGLSLSQDGLSYEQIRNIAFEAEKVGLDSFLLPDHLHSAPSADMQFLECWTVLSALATELKHIRLGTLVLNINNRNPALLAKMAATFDHISKGRLEFGIGAGGTVRAKLEKELGFEYEFVAYNIPFPRKPSLRIEKLDEGLEIMRSMWTQASATFSGKHYSIKDAICLPRPVQKPYMPIWIGGMSGTEIIKVIAKNADGWNMMRITTIEDYRLGLKRLKKACSRIGRDPDKIKTSIGISGSINECKEKLQRFEDEGLNLAILRFPHDQEIKYLKSL